MLDSAIKDQLKGLFAQLEAHYTFDIFVHPQHESRAELVDLLEEVASCSDKLSCRLQDSEGLKFILLKEGKDTGITFRAVPGGHEFTSLLMAVLNADKRIFPLVHPIVYGSIRILYIRRFIHHVHEIGRASCRERV